MSIPVEQDTAPYFAWTLPVLGFGILVATAISLAGIDPAWGLLGITVVILLFMFATDVTLRVSEEDRGRSGTVVLPR